MTSLTRPELKNYLSGSSMNERNSFTAVLDFDQLIVGVIPDGQLQVTR
jgi:hypothetical protein